MPSNEGKACDAVFRELERRIGAVRHDLIFPAEPAYPPQEQVEAIGFVGAQKFAIEHTYAEPFKGFRDLEHQAGPFKQKLFADLKGRLDSSTSFELTIPVGVLNGLGPQELELILRNTGDWIVATLPTLVPDPDDRAPVFRRAADSDIPFMLFLRRRDFTPFPPSFHFSSLVSGDTEKMRRKRLRETYWRKSSKLLAVKKTHDTRTVLILENDDEQGTNHVSVAEAVRRVEKGRLPERPDEVYLIDTKVTPWYLYPIRIDGHWLYNKGEPGGRYRKSDPAQLIDITTAGRARKLSS
jgi:hypothetical protein